MHKLALALILLASTGSLLADNTLNEKPIFPITRADVYTTAITYITNPNNVAKLPDTNKTVAIWIKLSSPAAAHFETFTRQHLHQPAQIHVGTNLVSDLTISSVVTNGEFDLFFATGKEALNVYHALGIN
jgi:hypothetical protein